MRIQEVLADAMAKIRRFEGERVREECAAGNAERHKLTTYFDKGLNYRYYSDPHDPRVKHCYSVNRNVAGYFLAWTETRGASETRRNQFYAHKMKRNVISLARSRAR